VRRTTKRRAQVALQLARTAPLGTTSWRAAKSLLTLRAQVDARWPGRRTDRDGTIGDAAHQARDSDHNPWVRDGLIGVVTAIDITHDPASGCDAEALVSALVISRDRRIKYIIWNRRIISATVSPWIWRAYTGRNPHTKHFHLSVSASKPLYDAQEPWALGSPA
jgi:hypothetical protein